MTTTMEKWMAHKKKLIEVALPLEKINEACVREKSIRHGHPSTLHLWWSRKPLAAARAVIFAQMIDDPSGHPEEFPTIESQEKERQRLFDLLEELVKWENTNNEEILNLARNEIWRNWRRTCKENKDDPRAKELFNPEKLPGFHDPFAGGGALPLEAQRLGLESYASDLNPVAVLINKAMIEIPPRFSGMTPVNPTSRIEIPKGWKGAQGLAEDVNYYGTWMREEAVKRIGHFYPQVEITKEMAKDRPDLKGMEGKKLTIIAWLWARTVKSPNPAYAHIDVPLVSTFILSSKPGKEAYIEVTTSKNDYQFRVKKEKPERIEILKKGTKLARGANFQCIMSGIPIESNYVKAEGKAKRMGSRLMAIVAEGKNGRIYLSPFKEMEELARKADPVWMPDAPLANDPRALWTPSYGLTTFADLFTPRQLVALTTFSDLVQEARQLAFKDAVAAGMPNDDKELEAGGNGAGAYADAVAVYLGMAVSKYADLNNSLCNWEPGAQCPKHLFGRQAIPMSWDYPESNSLGEKSGSWQINLEGIVKAFAKNFEFSHIASLGVATQKDAATQTISQNKLVSTDPPYYDNIGYSDLSDFFYIWLRRSLQPIFPSLFSTLITPKTEELVATPYRHGDKEKAESFFLNGMTRAMTQLTAQTHPDFPTTIYYAFKQSETSKEEGTSSTGWETFLEAVLQSGLVLTGTLPLRSELSNRMNGLETNALASSIVLICRPRCPTAPTISRREFLSHLRRELPPAIHRLKSGHLSATDLRQASIGPGMAVFSRYAKVLDAEGKAMTVRDALSLINQILDETQAEGDHDLDNETRWAIAWFEDSSFTEGTFGKAETLSKTTNVSIENMVKAGILFAKSGKVRLLKPNELFSAFDPQTKPNTTIWEITHQIIRSLEHGEQAAADLVAKLGSKADAAIDLAYRLYGTCELKKRAQDAYIYNMLVQSWPDVKRLAQQKSAKAEKQESFI